ncbi:DUF1993 family protein [Aliiglaciecola sp. LCG003]|uniref:DUF1993 family protein n=1 Tax=Aliiglaciecola sp. LCG003 TaxID=3053655 RepID=UPI003365ACFF
MAGSVKVSLTTSAFLNNFARANFFFHLSVVYVIARSRGISITKGDYDGFPFE